jgi:hypothetical protein
MRASRQFALRPHFGLQLDDSYNKLRLLKMEDL